MTSLLRNPSFPGALQLGFEAAPLSARPPLNLDEIVARPPLNLVEIVERPPLMIGAKTARAKLRTSSALVSDLFLI